MAKRAKRVAELGDDIVDRLVDLHRRATVERSPYYGGRCVSDAINETTPLRKPGQLQQSPACAGGHGTDPHEQNTHFPLMGFIRCRHRLQT
jgi:hypothetical protein